MGMSRPPLLKGSASFVSQSYHGVRSDGAPSRDVARCDRDEEQYYGGSGECDWVVCTDAKEQSGQQTHQAERNGDADDDANGGEFYTMTHDEKQNVVALRAESHADAYFVRALLNAVRDYAVNSNGSEDERESAEKAEQYEGDVRRGNGIVNQFFHGMDVENGLILVNAGDCVPNG